jgi:peroxisomal trans-2-enoyl-CoA reductase
VFRPGLFTGKSAIVTGGGTGIGKAITSELLYLGCNVLIAARNEPRLQEAAQEMKAMLPANNPAQIDVMTCNIRKEDQVKSMISRAIERFGGLDFLVNNGGGQFNCPAEKISLKGWNAVVETNLTGSFLCCREAYTQWMQDNGGAIVTIITNMFNGWPGMSPSGAARAGVENFTKSLAIEWAPSGVRLNCVAPGSSIYSETAAANYGPDKARELFDVQVPRIPAKRLGKTEEISSSVMFLLSPAAAFISGATLRVDGAQSLYTTSSPWTVPDHNRSKPYTWEDDLEDQKKSKL